MKLTTRLLILLVMLANGFFAQNVINNNGLDIIEKTLVLKVKSENRAFFEKGEFNDPYLKNLFDRIKHTRFSKKFPLHKQPEVYGDDPTSYKQVDLSVVYELEYTANYDEYVVASYFQSTGLFEYVEPLVVPALLYSPNDPDHSKQYHLTQMDAYKAWDIEKGDTTVIVGITDTGTNLAHPDLNKVLKRNYNDPINGVDDDNDGYIDNFNGWDLGMNDNDPTWEASAHGVFVTGCATADTDNGAHGAAIGFNSMYLPVKISNSSGSLTKAYEGIVYAADQGCSVINCSWGSQGGKSQFGQDVVDYATFNKNAVIVAAAGNKNVESFYYPASYDNVISVGGVDENDNKWVKDASKGSNWNTLVDVMAASSGIFSTSKKSAGVIGGGTSMASPMVAGTAALVRAKYPSYTPNQVAGLVMMNSDDIYGVGSNSSYLGKLGYGRVNAYKALNDNSKPFLSFLDYEVTDGFDNNFVIGDTMQITVKVINYLQKSSIGEVRLSTSNTNVKILNDTSVLASLDMMESKNANDRFKVVIEKTNGTNEEVVFDVEIEADGYVWRSQLSVEINRDYIDVTVNDLDFSFNNYGRIGYTYTGAGLGVKHGDSKLINQMGVIIGTSTDTVLSYEDYELLGFGGSSLTTSGTIADYEVVGEFDDSWAPIQLGLKVKQCAFVWNNSKDKDYVIYEYTVYNPTANPIKDMYFGVYGDWDIGSKSSNKADFNAEENFGYVYEEGGYYGGIKALRTSKSNYYAFNKDGSNGSMNIDDGFDDAEEFASISSGNSRTVASSGDISQVVSHGPYTVASGDSLTLAFAIIAGPDLGTVLEASKVAESKYEEIRGIKLDINDLKNVSCNGKNDGAIGVTVDAGLKPYTMEWLHDSQEKKSSLGNLSSGVYQIRVTDKNDIMKLMNFQITEPDSLKLSLSTNSVLLDCNGDDVKVAATVTGGTSGYSYNWNNPVVSGIPSPTLKAGTYNLTVTDSRGCEDSGTVVISEPNKLEAVLNDIKHDSTNACLGMVDARPSGGTAPYSILWDDNNAQTTQIANGLCQGEYTVEITDANGCLTKEKFAVNGGPDGIFEYNLTQLSAYPNPTQGVITISLNGTEQNVSYFVYNTLGELVLSDLQNTPSNTLVFNTSNLPTGSYHVMIKGQISSYGATFNTVR